jgi:OFA family oxalate/formate antiporter-like MFS transporter
MAFATSLTMAIVGISIVGFGFGGMIPVRPALLADFFGTRNFGTISGIGQLLGTTSGALGPFIMGVTVDQTGSYQNGWLIAMAVTALSIPCFLLLKPPNELIAEYRDARPVTAPAAH